MQGNLHSDHDAVEDRAFRMLADCGESWMRRMLRALKKEAQYIREVEDHWRMLRARRAAKLQAEELKAIKADDHDFNTWSLARARNIRDFDYLLLHRERLPDQIKEHLEVAAEKLAYTTQDGKPGYFQKLEQNIGWKDYIAPVIMSQPVMADAIVRCGIWANARNSGRCHKTDLCAFCLWNDYLRAQFEAFGTASNAFIRSPNWLFITIGFTTQRKNSKAVGKDLDRDDFAFVRGDHLYDPFPICLGGGDDVPDCEFIGYNDAQALGRIVQDALDALYKAKTILGYRSKLEGAFMLIPEHAKRVNLHGHAVANGPDRNVQSIAVWLRDFVNEKLQQHQRFLYRRYFGDVVVLRINTAEDLERCILYSEKVVPIDKIVADALNHPTAIGADGNLDAVYVDALKVMLKELIDDDLPILFGSFDSDTGPGRLTRRKVVGNMKFRDGDGCIGDEPDWHVTQRRSRAKAQRERREKARANSMAKKSKPPKTSAAQKARMRKSRQRIIHDPNHEF